MTLPENKVLFPWTFVVVLIVFLCMVILDDAIAHKKIDSISGYDPTTK